MWLLVHPNSHLLSVTSVSMCVLCVCVFLLVCPSVGVDAKGYVCQSVCLFMFLSMCVSVYLYVPAYVVCPCPCGLQMYVCVSVCFCVFFCVYVHVSTCVCVCLFVLPVCLVCLGGGYVCMTACLYLFGRKVCVSVSMCLYVHGCVHLCICVYMSVVCVCIRAPLWRSQTCEKVGGR